MSLSTSQHFEELLQQNLSLYTTCTTENGADLFHATREISIARYALSQQALAYQKSVEILFSTLQTIEEIVTANPTDPAVANLRSQIMVSVNAIESKSKALIESSHRVTELLGKAVSIDVDKASLKTMLINLPSIVRDSIVRVSQNEQLADQISTNLSSRISDLMIAVRFDDSPAFSGATSKAPTSGISFDQWLSMQDSIPTQPDFSSDLTPETVQ